MKNSYLSPFSGVQFQLPFLPGALENFTLPENFPDDSMLHQAARNAAEQFYREIPGNTPESFQLLNDPDFKIEHYKYDGAVDNFLFRIAFAEHHINTYINTSDWFGGITDYVHYLIKSLGKPYFSLDQLLVTVICQYIESNIKPNYPTKAQTLLNYFQPSPDDELANQVDLNQLLRVYDKWLNTFPFNFPSLVFLKEKLSSTRPVLKEGGVNRYSGIHWVRFKTRRQLLEWLREKTEQLLGAVNSPAMIDSWGISERKAHQLSLIWEKRRVAQYRNLNRFTKGENRYYEVIENWLKEEQETIRLLIEHSPDAQAAIPSTEQTTIKAKNRFNDMPLDEVRKWFMQLATRNSGNGRPYLTADKVDIFINRAFIKDESLPKLSLNIGVGEKMSVRKLFYQYFLVCTNDYAIEPTKHRKDKYVRLLTDNFTNYNYKPVFDTFNKAMDAPIDWSITV